MSLEIKTGQGERDNLQEMGEQALSQMQEKSYSHDASGGSSERAAPRDGFGAKK